jgi:hypothetical protein
MGSANLSERRGVVIVIRASPSALREAETLGRAEAAATSVTLRSVARLFEHGSVEALRSDRARCAESACVVVGVALLLADVVGRRKERGDGRHPEVDRGTTSGTVPPRRLRLLGQREVGRHQSRHRARRLANEAGPDVRLRLAVTLGAGVLDEALAHRVHAVRRRRGRRGRHELTLAEGGGDHVGTIGVQSLGVLRINGTAHGAHVGQNSSTMLSWTFSVPSSASQYRTLPLLSATTVAPAGLHSWRPSASV